MHQNILHCCDVNIPKLNHILLKKPKFESLNKIQKQYLDVIPLLMAQW